MDINDTRVAVTLVTFALFIALVARTWSRRRRGEHERAALLPFGDEAADARGAHDWHGAYEAHDPAAAVEQDGRRA